MGDRFDGDPAVSVVVPTHNAGDRFGALLNAIADQRYDGTVETVVVDSESTDNTIERARDSGATVREVPHEAFHHGRTRNLGAETATGDVLVYLTQDAVPGDDGWLRRLVDALDDRSVGVAYGRQVPVDGTPPMERHFYRYFYPEEPRRVTPEEANDVGDFYLGNVFVSNVCAAIPASVWADVQFDEDVDRAEDKEFGWRVLRAGYELRYVPEASVRHSHRYDLRSLARRRFEDGASFGTVAQGSNGGFLRRAVGYYVDELRYLLGNGHAHWLPYAVVYDLTYLVSFQLGRVYARLDQGITGTRV